VNNDKKLLPGMVAEVSIPLTGDNANTFVVPSKAVLNSTQGVYVIKVVNNKTIWVPVKTGRKVDDRTEIFGDLALNDVIIKTASEEIRDSAEVKHLTIAGVK
jgi:multidrug efflux pump subunit AcrA (membrane-fusion protein)